MSAFDSHVQRRVQDARRIVLVNPTKFLGNLLLSGGLVQQLAQWCIQHDKQLLLVLDESFASLVAEAFPAAKLIFYPRRALLPGSALVPGLLAFGRCVAAIRQFKADVAFTIEEDSVCHRLAHLSGARFKVSSTVHRYHVGFDKVLDIPRSGREAAEASIWFSVRDIFLQLGIPVTGSPAYLQLSPPAPDAALQQRLQALGVSAEKPLLLIHAGASKPYKQWPDSHFAELALAAIKKGYQPCLIGAGQSDQTINRRLLTMLDALISADQAVAGNADLPVCADLCNQLSLSELASLMTVSARMVGNDSGPSHLASALGLPGVVIFGPTDIEIWQPLSASTRVLENKSRCARDCTRHHCQYAYRCLGEIQPAQVIAQLL